MADTSAPSWRATLKRRLVVTAVTLGLWSVGIQARLVYLQVIRHDALVARASQQLSGEVKIPGRRGDILDRSGHVLARSADVQSIVAYPPDIEDVNATVRALCAALADCTAAERLDLVRKFGSDKEFAWVRRQAAPDAVQRVEQQKKKEKENQNENQKQKLNGIGFLTESQRVYPNRDLAAHLLGYVGVEGKGLAGIEATYDSRISGREGKLLVQRDANRVPFQNRVETAATEGESVELTIDENIQYIAERELRAGVVENKAVGGSAIVMDPWTSEVLALVNVPSFNPNIRPSRGTQLRNRAVEDLIDPGSTFKIVTASAALEQHLFKLDDIIDVSGGQIRFGSDVVHDTHDYHALSFTDVIVKSSNVGAIKVGLTVGRQHLGEWIKRFGFGRHTSRQDFPAESTGLVPNLDKIPDSELARVSMGYQVGVTPLQMAAAVSSIANGGELIQPRVVRAFIKDGVRREQPKVVVNRTVTPEVAAELTTIMEGVVERGTATAAQIPGYAIAGKTGTASKLIGGRYSKTDYNASFVGFVPARKPVYTIMVVLDSPKGPHGYYGGPVSGPIFRRIAEELLRYTGVPHSLNADPPVLVQRASDTGREVPASGPAVAPRVAPPAGGDALVPDLTGLSAREALSTTARLGLKPSLHGTGVVVDQRPGPGTPLQSATRIDVWLARQSSVLRVADPTTR